jgi:hypothetical protein
MENTNPAPHLTPATPEQIAAIRAAVIEVSADYYGIPVPLAAALVDGDRDAAQTWPVCAFHGPHGAAENGQPLSFCERCESAL